MGASIPKSQKVLRALRKSSIPPSRADESSGRDPRPEGSHMHGTEVESFKRGAVQPFVKRLKLNTIYGFGWKSLRPQAYTVRLLRVADSTSWKTLGISMIRCLADLRMCCDKRAKSWLGAAPYSWQKMLSKDLIMLRKIETATCGDEWVTLSRTSKLIS